MASFIQLALRHNLSKLIAITKNSFSKQHVRHPHRWTHRRPLQVIYAEDSSNDEHKYAEKLKIERQNILLREREQGLSGKKGVKYRDRRNAIDTGVSQAKNISFLEPTTDVNVIEVNGSSNEQDCEDKEIKTEMRETKPKNDLQYKTKRERKLERKKEMKQLKIEESAAKAGVPLYTKLSDDDPKLSNVMLIVKSKNRKKKRSHILLEGKRLIKDAIEANFLPQMVFFSRVKDAADLNLPDGVELYKLPYKTISLWSDLSTSSGVIGIFKTPSLNVIKTDRNTLPLTIVCDNVRDPGNLGAILRGAAGVGCQKVILTKGCVDLWDPKVLRSGAGAHFRTVIINDIEWTELEDHVDREGRVFLADNSVCTLQNDKEINVHNNIVTQCETEVDSTMECKDANFGSLDLYEDCKNSVPVVPYFAVDFVNQVPIILVIGGETEGLNINSFHLAQSRGGIRLNIPLSNNVESLNSGTALGIIVFEMKRQLLRNFQDNLRERIDEKMERIHLPSV